MAYYQLEPWGEYQSDRRAAVITSTMANIHRGKRNPYKLEDFMPKYDRQAMTWQEQKELLIKSFGLH